MYDNILAGEISISVITDAVAPEITSVTDRNVLSSGEWTTQKEITVNGTSKLNSIVYVSMYYPDGKAVYENQACTVINDSYSYKAIYNIEAKEPTTFKVKVTDDYGNISESNITLSKVDSEAPTMVSPKEYIGEWSKYKDIKIETIDNGVGEVQIGFNAVADYQVAQKEGENYIRNYRIVGDIYEDFIGAIYLKDGLGNIRTEKVTIGKVDGTSPTITNILQEGLKIKVEANDQNTKLGKEGSGVAGYAYSVRNEVPSDKKFQSGNELTLPKEGTYYIWVKDNAGNLSEVRSVKVK